jgi:hypothetical protein
VRPLGDGSYFRSQNFHLENSPDLVMIRATVHSNERDVALRLRIMSNSFSVRCPVVVTMWIVLFLLLSAGDRYVACFGCRSQSSAVRSSPNLETFCTYHEVRFQCTLRSTPDAKAQSSSILLHFVSVLVFIFCYLPSQLWHVMLQDSSQFFFHPYQGGLHLRTFSFS